MLFGGGGHREEPQREGMRSGLRNVALLPGVAEIADGVRESLECLSACSGGTEEIKEHNRSMLGRVSKTTSLSNE